ncbi:uncharacterized protein AAES06_006798 [Glossophaga mutica]
MTIMAATGTRRDKSGAGRRSPILQKFSRHKDVKRSHETKQVLSIELNALKPSAMAHNQKKANKRRKEIETDFQNGMLQIKAMTQKSGSWSGLLVLLVLERHRLGFPQLRLQLIVEHRAVEKAKHHCQQQQRLEDPLLLSGAHPVSHSPRRTARRGRPFLPSARASASAAAAAGGGRTQHQETRDRHKSGAQGEVAPAQPPRAVGRTAMDATGAAAAKLLRGWLSASAGAWEGALRILLSVVSSPRSPDASCLYFSSPLFGSAAPRGARSPALAAPRPLAAVPTTRLLCHQKEGVRAQQRDPGSRRCHRGAWGGVGDRWGLAAPQALGDGGPLSLTGLRSPGRRRLPPNLRVTHRSAILANGIPGGSPTRAPRSLGPSELRLPPFGEAMPGSIGRPLCPSDPRAAPSLPLRGRPGASGSPQPLTPKCTHVEYGQGLCSLCGSVAGWSPALSLTPQSLVQIPVSSWLSGATT